MRVGRPFTFLVAALMLLTMLPSFALAQKGDKEDCETWVLGVIHGINGQKLGLDRELPVDVYVNDGYAFTFEFRDTIKAELPFGEYTFDVRLAGADPDSEPVISLGPAEFYGCLKVVVKAKLVDGVPTLAVLRVREL